MLLHRLCGVLFKEKKWIILALTRQIDANKHPVSDEAMELFEDPRDFDAALTPVNAGTRDHQYVGQDHPALQRDAHNAGLDRNFTEELEYPSLQRGGPGVFQNTDTCGQQQVYPALYNRGMADVYALDNASLCRRQQPQSSTHQIRGSLPGIHNNNTAPHNRLLISLAQEQWTLPKEEEEVDPGMSECDSGLHHQEMDPDHRFQGAMTSVPRNTGFHPLRKAQLCYSRKRKAAHGLQLQDRDVSQRHTWSDKDLK